MNTDAFPAPSAKIVHTRGGFFGRFIAYWGLRLHTCRRCPVRRFRILQRMRLRAWLKWPLPREVKNSSSETSTGGKLWDDIIQQINEGGDFILKQSIGEASGSGDIRRNGICEGELMVELQQYVVSREG